MTSSDEDDRKSKSNRQYRKRTRGDSSDEEDRRRARSKHSSKHGDKERRRRHGDISGDDLDSPKRKSHDKEKSKEDSRRLKVSREGNDTESAADKELREAREAVASSAKGKTEEVVLKVEDAKADAENAKAAEAAEKKRRRALQWQEQLKKMQEQEAQNLASKDDKKEDGEIDLNPKPAPSKPGQREGKALLAVSDDDDEDNVVTGRGRAHGRGRGIGFLSSDSEDDNAIKKPAPPAGDDEVDPLDAFMAAQVLPEVKRLEMSGAANGTAPAGAAAVSAPGGSAAATPPAAEAEASSRAGEDANGAKPVVKKQAEAAGGGPGAAVPGGSKKAGLPRRGMRVDAGEESDAEGYESGEGGEPEEEETVAKVAKADKMVMVDHAKVKYTEFRKDFYIMPKEIAKMTDAEVVAMRKEMDGIKVRGKDVPRPIRSWVQAGLSNRVLDSLKKLGCEKPMPIQAQALPVIMSGRDCIGIAKTGSGKTFAFVLPMLRHVMDQPPLAQGDGPIALIMAPTRELCQQIYNDIKRLAKPLGLSCVAVFGGSGVAEQIGILKRGVEIVVCTPGRMIDILCTSGGRITNLKRVTYCVLDEADRMFDMGFEPQISRIVANIRPSRQTVLFSATFPHTVETLARKVLTNPVEIQVGARSVVNKDITQMVEVREEGDRFLRVLELLGEWMDKGKVLIFVHSQEKADGMFRDLLKVGYPCLSLHGGKDQQDREGTLADFKGGICNLLVATSIAARGLDVKDLQLVINYDVPNHYEDYVHRVGRTGRAGRKGTAVTFIAPEEERFAPDIVKALEQSGSPIPEDLAKLADGFNAKVKAGLVQAHGSGFGGSGFRFSIAEEAARKESRKMQLLEYGYAEEKEAEESDEDEREGGDTKRPGAAGPQADGTIIRVVKGVVGAGTSGGAARSGPTAPLSAAVLAAKAAAEAILAQKKAATGAEPMSAAKAAAQAMAMAVQAKLGVAVPGAAPGVASAAPAGEEAGEQFHYACELEINDYPQHARWKVTHRETMAQITEFTGAAITTKGQYFAPNRPPPTGTERKLYLVIEGPTESIVKKARAEVKRVIEESSGGQYGPSGGHKYSLT